MSLRDALVAKGLVSKKRAKKVERELKSERKQQQGKRRKKKHVQVEEHAAAQRARAAEARAKATAREEREAIEAQHEHKLRVRAIVLAHRLGGRGPVPFHYKRGDNGALGVMKLSPQLARDVRAGRASIAGFPQPDGTWMHHVIAEKGADKLRELAPELLVHDARLMGGGLDDEAEVLPEVAGQVDLRAHKVRPGEDLSRFLEPR